MTWFRREKKPLETAPADKRVQTEGLWTKCEACKKILWKKDLEQNLLCCPKCNHHLKMSSQSRLAMLFDDGKYVEHDTGLSSPDPLEFVDRKAYRDRLASAEKVTGIKDAVRVGEGKIAGKPLIICAMEFQFIGGSMGAVVGEKIARAIDRCIQSKLPLVIVSCSGGARMMEGAISLMQLAKISASLARLEEVRKPYISVLTNPTTGGTTASFAMLGDLNIAEPGALIGFAGPRVIEQTIHQKLPEGFQTAEFLLAHGMLDAIVPRTELKDYLAKTLDYMGAWNLTEAPK
ncbi:MAG: acetyl-CoA carboxylase, carboxyltransferase subunit beta [Acidobacteria bacterium]|nr:acetyl-CoA carboxylase, carboxyltransferase subunit beta [Acidobacteriota bacterium]